MSNKEKRTIPASNFLGTIALNVDSKKLSDKKFRQIFRNTLPIVIYGEYEPKSISATMPYRDAMDLMAVFRESELSSHASINFKRDESGDWKVTITIEDHAKFLLISSFEDGMLSKWNSFFGLSRLHSL